MFGPGAFDCHSEHNIQAKILCNFKKFEFIVLIARLVFQRNVKSHLFIVYIGNYKAIYALFLRKTSRRRLMEIKR